MGPVALQSPGVPGVPQHLTALAKGNEKRLARAQLKRDLKAGRISLEHALRAECADTMELFDLLKALPRTGRVGAGRRMLEAQISAAKVVGSLTDRQILELAGAGR